MLVHHADLYPSVNTPLVDQYLAANGIILAKTNLGELQSGYATNPNSPTCDYCTTALNPYDPTRSPQGEHVSYARPWLMPRLLVCIPC